MLGLGRWALEVGSWQSERCSRVSAVDTPQTRATLRFRAVILYFN
jgi:hypothetical protein